MIKIVFFLIYKIIIGTEDVEVAKCLRKLGVYPGNSTDDLGRERFHPLSLTAHYNGDFPPWLYKYASNPVQKVTKIMKIY